jgi:hypothetical protein
VTSCSARPWRAAISQALARRTLRVTLNILSTWVRSHCWYGTAGLGRAAGAGAGAGDAELAGRLSGDGAGLGAGDGVGAGTGVDVEVEAVGVGEAMVPPRRARRLRRIWREPTEPGCAYFLCVRHGSVFWHDGWSRVVMLYALLSTSRTWLNAKTSASSLPSDAATHTFPR